MSDAHLFAYTISSLLLGGGLAVYLVIAATAAILGGILAARKHRSAAGWALLCLLIPICVLFILALWPLPDPKDRKTQCPHCLGEIRLGAKVCMHCRGDLKEVNTLRNALQPDAAKASSLDWNCPKCGILNKEQRATCASCRTPNPHAKHEQPNA